MRRATILVLDGVGTGELPDAYLYGDSGSDTLGNLAKEVGGLDLPNLERLGLGLLHSIPGIQPVSEPAASYGRMAELSAGKDSTTGHWEMMGIVTPTPFPIYPNGFPEEIIAALERATCRSVIGNRAASGTEIIEELGPEHQESGDLIVYTSADSVLQIAAHEDTVPLEELYAACAEARRLLSPPHQVSRVIARPFTGPPGSYARMMEGRRDYATDPPVPNLLSEMERAGIPRTGVGKVDDLFNRRSLTTVHVGDNSEGLTVLEDLLGSVEGGLIFANLVDFDTRWGHRNDSEGFVRGLQEIDERLPALLGQMRGASGDGCTDLLIITADHGNDPTTPSTDHSREHVPLLVHTPGSAGSDLGIRSSFCDIAATLVELFDLDSVLPGSSFLQQVLHGRGLPDGSRR